MRIMCNDGEISSVETERNSILHRNRNGEIMSRADDIEKDICGLYREFPRETRPYRKGERFLLTRFMTMGYMTALKLAHEFDQ